jgi:hypothetical protein
LSQDDEARRRIRLRDELGSAHGAFRFPLVDRVETAFENLNRLLMNQAPPGGRGFMESLRERKISQALLTTYHFLRQERLAASAADPARGDSLRILEGRLEEVMSGRNGLRTPDGIHRWDGLLTSPDD